jgi:hypothetical protein
MLSHLSAVGRLIIRAVSLLMIGVFELSVTCLAPLGSIVLLRARQAISRCRGRCPAPGHRRKSRYALAALGLFPLLLLSAVAGGRGPRAAPPSLAIPTAVPLDPSPFAAPPTPTTAPSNEVCCDKSSDDQGKIVAEAALEPRTEVVPEVAAHPVPDPNPVAPSAPEPEVRQGPSEQRLRDLRSTIEHRRRRREAGAARQREALREMMLPPPSATRPAGPPSGRHGTCTGSANCRACSNCSECRHCNSGGRCGVCAR